MSVRFGFFFFSISNLAFLLEGPFHFSFLPKDGGNLFFPEPPRASSLDATSCLSACLPSGLSSLPSPKTRNPPPVQPSPTEAERKEGRGGWTVGATSFFSPFSSSFHQSDLPQGHNFYKRGKGCSAKKRRSGEEGGNDKWIAHRGRGERRKREMAWTLLLLAPSHSSPPLHHPKLRRDGPSFLRLTFSLAFVTLA